MQSQTFPFMLVEKSTNYDFDIGQMLYAEGNEYLNIIVSVAKCIKVCVLGWHSMYTKMEIIKYLFCPWHGKNI